MILWSISTQLHSLQYLMAIISTTLVPFLLAMNSNFFGISVSRLMFTDDSPAAFRDEALRASTIPLVVMAIEESPGNRDSSPK